MPAPPSVNNYTKFTGHRIDIGNGYFSNRYYADVNVPDHDDGKLSELVAWMCNQTDNCRGFMRRRVNFEFWFWLTTEHGGSTTVPHSPTTDTTLDTYVKNSLTVRKANNPDTSDPSILTSPKTKIVFNNASDNFNTGGAVGSSNSVHPLFTQAYGGLPDNPALNIGPNNINEVTVPLGWRFLDGDNGWASGQSGCCHNSVLTGDNYKKNSWGHYQDGILVENRGFDVNAEWQTMSAKGVHPDDEKLIKFKWCTQNLDNLKTTQCQQFFAAPSNSYNYDVSYLQLCNSVSGGWQTSADCIHEVNIMLNQTSTSTNNPSQVTASGMVQTFCNANPTNPLCACYNVTNAAYDCLKAQKTLPGCADLNSQIGTLPPDAQITWADRFCASVACNDARTGNGVLMPAQRNPSQNCPDITQCITDLRNAVLTDSNLAISQQCKTTVGSANSPSTHNAKVAADAAAAKATADAAAAKATTPPANTPPANTPPANTPPANTPPGITPSGTPTVDNNQTAIVAGGGILGILCSFGAFCCCILLMFLLFSGGGSKKSGPYAPMSAYASGL